LMFIMELLSSQYLRCMICMIIEVTEPVALEHGNLVTYMRSSSRVRDWYGMSTGPCIWRHTVAKLYQVLTDLGALARCSFDTDVSGQWEEDEGATLAQDTLAEELHRMVVSQAFQRSKLGIEMSGCYPARLAALTLDGHYKEKYGAQHEQELRDSLKAFKEVTEKNKKHPIIDQMLRNSWWNTGLGWFIRSFLDDGDSKAFSILLIWLRWMFSGQGMSKPVEEANRFVRNYILKFRGTTVSTLVSAWMMPRRHHVCGQYGIREVQPESTMPIDETPPDDLFHVSNVSISTEAGASNLDLPSIMKEPAVFVQVESHEHWVIGAEDQIFQAWVAAQSLSPGTLWQARLLPQWQVIVDKRHPEDFIFVLGHVGKRAALAQRVCLDEDDFFAMPTRSQDVAPYFQLVDDARQFEVIRTRAVSIRGIEACKKSRDKYLAKEKNNRSDQLFRMEPMRMHEEIRKDKEKEAEEKKRRAARKTPEVGIKLGRDWDNPAPIGLLNWHVAYAFTGLDSVDLENLIRSFPLLPQSLVDAAMKEAYDADNAYALALMLHLGEDSVTMLAALRALRARKKKLSRDINVGGLRSLWEADILHDLVAKEDMEGFKEFITQTEEHQAKFRIAAKSVRGQVETVYKTRMGADEFEKEKELLDAELKPTWKSSVVLGDSTEQIIEKLKPPEVNVKTVQGHACFTVTRQHPAPNKKRYVESYSYERIRKPAQALKMSLHKAWETWEEDNGTTTPQAFINAINEIADDLKLNL
jgi:hypothetical protein